MTDTVQNPFMAPAGNSPAVADGPWNDFAPKAAPQAADGPWNDFAPHAAPQTAAAGPWNDFAGAGGETDVAKTSQGAPMAPPPTFRQGPSIGAGRGEVVEPSQFDRFMNGISQGYTGAFQLAAHHPEYFAPAGLGYVAKAAAPQFAQQTADMTDKWAQQDAAEEAELRRKAALPAENTDWWNVAGQVASPVNYVGGGLGEAAVAKGAAALPRVIRPVAENAMARGVGAGVGMGAVQPVTSGDYDTEKARQIGENALAGGIGGPLISGAGSIVKPAIGQAAQALEDAGVRLTPGQLMGGWAKRAEDIAQSYPFVGDLIRKARDQGGKQFQVGAANRALAPIGEKVDKGIVPGPDLINHVEGKISDAYNRIHPNVNLAIDQPLAADLAGVVINARTVLPDAEINQLGRVIQSQVSGKIAQNGNVAPGTVVQSITSELGRMRAGYATSPDFDKRQLGTFIGDARQAINDALSRQNPAFAPELQKANAAWQLYAKLRDAAGRAGGPTGEFSPAQLENAAKKGATAGMKAKGTAPMQDYAAAGREVLGAKVPDSGVTERSLGILAMHGGLHGLGHMTLGPGIWAPAATIAALYNPVGRAIARGAILSRPPGAQAVRDILQKYAPAAAARLPLLNQGQQP